MRKILNSIIMSKKPRIFTKDWFGRHGARLGAAIQFQKRQAGMEMRSAMNFEPQPSTVAAVR